MSNGKNAFSQPVIAGGYVPAGLTASTYAKGTFGCSAINEGAIGSTLVTFDEPIPLVGGLPQYVVTAVAVPGGLTKGVSVLVTNCVADQFNIDCLDDVHLAVDSGVMFTVTLIPRTT